MRRRTVLGGGLGALALSLGGLSGAWAAGGRARRLIVVFANGGWDPTFTLDPKLGNPAIEGPEVDEDPDDPNDREALQTVAGIRLITNPVKRPAVTRYFERWGSQTAVLNGVWVGNIAHDPCRWRMLSGRVDGRGPDVVTIAGAHLGADLPLGSLDTSGLGLAGPLAASVGSAGARSQLEMLLDPASSPPIDGAPSPGFVPTAGERSAVDQFLAARAARGADAWGALGPSAYGALDEARLRADRLVGARDALVRGLEIGTAPSISTLVPTTLELLGSDVCSAVLLDSGHKWDTHETNDTQHRHFEQLFTDLDTLMQALSTAGLLSTTLVAVMSEMGRTPRRNAALGKDHWPYTSAMLMGAGVTGGRVLGGTDDLQESLPVDYATGEVDPAGALLKYDNLLAGILAMLDVDPGPFLPGSVPFLGAQA